MSKYNYTFTSPSGVQKLKPITLSTKLILHEAESLGINWSIVEGTEIIELSYGSRKECFRHQVSPLNTNVALYGCSQKHMVKAILKKGKVSVAQGFVINKSDDEDYILEVFNSLKKPLVVKPVEGSHGDFVTVNIKRLENFKKVIEKTLQQDDDIKFSVLAEEMFTGTEYRITTIREKVLGITNRVPANVTGDGHSTIEELIEEKNQDPRREDDFYNTGLKKIPINDETIWALSEQGISLEAIPKKDQKVFVRLNSNLSTGGDSIDFTDKVHPSVKEIAIKAINAVPGLEFAGIDFMTSDITKKQTDDSYIIVEINTSPGIFMHDKPFIGKNRHTAREFLFLIFPELRK